MQRTEGEKPVTLQLDPKLFDEMPLCIYILFFDAHFPCGVTELSEVISFFVCLC